MRCPSPHLPVLAVLAALFASGASGACSPSLQPPGGNVTPFADDASALSSFDDDGGWGDDAGEAGEPAWDADPVPGVDAISPFTPGDGSMPDTGSPADAEVDADCTQSLAAGDLLVDELMIESVDGAGDDGEWLEVASTAGCAVNLRGLHGECPVGAKVYTFDVVDDLWIPPGGTFIVADSTDPAVNHYLPGLVIAWGGHPGDVLRNLGGTVTLSEGNVLVVSLTWPSLKPAIGATVELPADCPAADADDFGEWQTATTSWFPGFFGTPNALNTDVECL